jgi:uncharacterized RDD family membrane protein YckC
MKSIDIRTAQNVTIEYQMATSGERMLSLFLDLVIVGGGYLLFVTLLQGAFRNSEWVDLGRFVFLLPIPTFLLYHFFFEVLNGGQSLGKKITGIKVVRIDGEEPSMTDSMLRSVFYIADLLLSGGVLGLLLISSTPRRQRLGDMAANTTVISVKAEHLFLLNDIMKISTLEDYQPRYPEVRQFSEQDMLLIKNAVARYLRFRNYAHAAAIADLSRHVALQMGITPPGRDHVQFLETLIRDYIVLTR